MKTNYGKIKCAAKKLDETQILMILAEANDPANRHNLPKTFKGLAERFNCCVATIRKTACGKIHSSVRPEFSRLQRSGHGRSILTDQEVANARATFAAFPAHPGLVAALARHLRISWPPLQAILDGRHRQIASDIKGEVIPLEELEFRGSKMTTEIVLEIVHLWNSGLSLKKVASQVSTPKCPISPGQVSAVVCRKSWESVSEHLSIRPATKGPKTARHEI